MKTDPLVGEVLHDTHNVVRVIGQGGMGTVYEAVHARLSQRRFAIKVLNARMASKDVIYARFKREAEIATSLGHANIIDYIDGRRPLMARQGSRGHHVTVSAKGYESRTLRVTAQASRTLEMNLQKRPDPKPKPRPKPKPATKKTKLITDL